MIPRYSLPEMSDIWSEAHKYDTWIAVEVALLAAHEDLGNVPAGVTAAVRQSAKVDPAAIDRLETELKHDIIAFLTNLAESVGDNSRYVHLGMTSSDLIDTALALHIQHAGKLLLDKLDALHDAVLTRALEHKHTPMVGRSHGIHGEPITFGVKLLVWVDELRRQKQRLLAALEENRVGMFSGAMGTYSNITPEVEALACEKLGLKVAATSTQVIQRDIHAQFFLALANLASSIEKFSVELRHLQRTDVLEVEEAFTKGQKGSSAMPHKRNPISGENLTGLARLVRSYAVPALENIALWHERDISHSSVERLIFPDACIAMHYMLNRMTTLVANLQVFPENMLRNMNIHGGVIFSQRVMITLTERGVLREDAYRFVQRNAHTAWNVPGGDFKANLLSDTDVMAVLTPAELEACFDTADVLKHIDAIFDRVLATSTHSASPVLAGIA